jgi:PAS domain S-box-containing protein
MSTPLEILLVEDDSSTAMAIQQALAGLGHMVTYAGSGELALSIANRRKPQLAIVATALKGQPNGETTSRQLGDLEVPILLLSANMQDAKRLLDLKPLGGLIKPLRDGEMEMILSVAQNTVAERLDMKHRSHVLSGIVDNMIDSVLLVDRDRKIAFANASAARLIQSEQLVGSSLQTYFHPTDLGNEELDATLTSAISGSGTLGSGSRATLLTKTGQRMQVIVIVSTVRHQDGTVTSASMSFRPAPAASSETLPSETSQTSEAADENAANHQAVSTPLRAKAIHAIELRLATNIPSQKHYAVVLLLSQFDMFRLRYGLNNAEKLVHAFSAHLIKSLPPEDRLYQWSNRTVVVLLERDSTTDEVRLEMTAFCSRRVDYYLNATGRSALVTLSASWNLIPLFDCAKDANKIVEQIDGFEKMHSRKK